MRFFTSQLAIAAFLCGNSFAADAPKVTDNALGVSYLATLPDSVTTDVRGSVLASSDPSGTGVLFQISLSGLPADGQPFLYHIHDNPITNSNCSTAGGHLDPYLRGDSPACVSDSPATCQVGDLSGKHGKVNGTTFSANYVDSFVSTTPGAPAFLGNRSIVVHYSNKTMITCASFALHDSAINTSSSSTSTGSGSSSTTHLSSSTPSSTTSASKSTTAGVSASGSGTAAASSTGGATSMFAHGGVLLTWFFALLL